MVYLARFERATSASGGLRSIQLSYRYKGVTNGRNIVYRFRRSYNLIMEKIVLQIVSFETPAQWKKWLAENHENPNGIWLRIFKKASGQKSISYDQALDEALCYGWIDGQKNKYDEKSWIQKFTPRRPKSSWSKRNTEHVKRLIQTKKMRSAGLKQVEAAKKDGRWDQAYDSSSNSTIPEDFLKELKKNKKAQAFFATLNKSNLYAITYRLQTAKKPETRKKRIQTILEMMEKCKKFH